MDNMGTKHIILFLAGAAVGAFAMHFQMKVNAPAVRAQAVIKNETIKGLSSWH